MGENISHFFIVGDIMDYFSASESHTLSNHYVYYNRLLAPESGKRLNALGNKIVKELNSLDIGS